MITRISTVEENKELVGEILLNKTNKITKVSDESIVNGVAFGVAKVGQKAQKDIALIESYLFPDSSYGNKLDGVAEINGIPTRFEDSQSSTWVYLSAVEGTTYTVADNQFTSASGITFELEQDVTVGNIGYTYAKVRSLELGVKTNVDPYTITKLTNTPVGHIYVTNEFVGLGGRNVESDVTFRNRIKEGSNINAKSTIASIEQAFMQINNNVLRVVPQGLNSNGKYVLAIVTVNGIDLNSNELSELLERGESFLSISDLKSYGSTTVGVELRNIEYQPIDISFRAELFDNQDTDEVRKQIQIGMAKLFDPRYWSSQDKIEWDDLLQVAKSIVKYVPDEYFTPNADVQVDKNKFPRIRGFRLLDKNGNLLSNTTGTLNPIYFPENPDFKYQQTIVRV